MVVEENPLINPRVQKRFNLSFVDYQLLLLQSGMNNSVKMKEQQIDGTFYTTS
jgi:hypothetical protein